MPRAPRFDIAGIPQHLIVRGNNRGLLFADDNDRTAFLRYLRQSARSSESEVHAFVLMTNHVHVLATGRRAGSLSRFMQAVGRRYAQYVNRVHERTGTLFEGRFRSSLVDCERYFFTCMRYIELNPVRAGLVEDAGNYVWSSFSHNAGRDTFEWLVERPEYEALGVDKASRAAAYRALFRKPFAQDELEAVRAGIRKGCPIGSADFLGFVEQRLGRCATIGSQGRPRRGEKGI